jgi:hypothetical protein
MCERASHGQAQAPGVVHETPPKIVENPGQARPARQRHATFRLGLEEGPSSRSPSQEGDESKRRSILSRSPVSFTEETSPESADAVHRRERYLERKLDKLLLEPGASGGGMKGISLRVHQAVNTAVDALILSPWTDFLTTLTSKSDKGP